MNPAQLFLRDITIRSVISTSRNQLQDALQLVQQGLVKPVITGELPLERAAEAHRLLEAGNAFGRVLLRPGLHLALTAGQVDDGSDHHQRADNLQRGGGLTQHEPGNEHCRDGLNVHDGRIIDSPDARQHHE